MHISLQTLVDILVHATKEDFCFDNAKIEQFKTNETKLYIGIVDSEYHDVEVCITLYLDDEGNTLKKLSGCKVAITNLDGFNEISSFYANAIVGLEDGIRNILYGAEFFECELLEVSL